MIWLLVYNIYRCKFLILTTPPNCIITTKPYSCGYPTLSKLFNNSDKKYTSLISVFFLQLLLSTTYFVYAWPSLRILFPNFTVCENTSLVVVNQFFLHVKWIEQPDYMNRTPSILNPLPSK